MELCIMPQIMKKVADQLSQPTWANSLFFLYHNIRLIKAKLNQFMDYQSLIGIQGLYYLFSIIHFMAVLSWSVIVFIFFFAKQTFQASNFMSISQNKKYINSGTVSIDIASAVSWNPYSVNVTYPFSFSNSSVLGVFLTISDFNTNSNPSINVSFYGVVNTFSQTSFILNVYSRTNTIFASLGYRYTAIALNDKNTFGWILLPVIQSVYIYQTPYYCNFSTSVIVPLGAYYSLGFSRWNQYAISYLGYGFIFNSSGNSNYQIRLDISLQEGLYMNATNVSPSIVQSDKFSNNQQQSLTILTQSYPTATSSMEATSTVTAKMQICFYNYSYYFYYYNFALNGAYFNILIYNLSRDPTLPYIKSQFYYLNYQEYVNSTYIYYIKSVSYWPSTLFSTNRTYFYSNMQFKMSFSDYYANITSNYNNLGFGIITWFYTYYCPYSTPYLLNDTCYDVCRNETTTNQSQLTCNSNSTIPDSINSSMSPAFKAGAILGFISFFLILILMVAGFCLYKIKQKQQTRSQSVLNVNQPQSNQMIHSYKGKISENDPPNSKPETGVWREKSKDSLQKCSICHKEQANFKTDCGHSFHIKCIVTWSQKYDNCPYCKSEDLTQKLHRVFCRFCKENEKWLSFRDLKPKYYEGIHSEEFICPSCLNDPL